MKARNLYIFSLVAVSVLLFNRGILAQSVGSVEIVSAIEQTVDCSQNTLAHAKVNPSSTIMEEDYPFLKNIECLKNGYFQNYRGWNLKFRNANNRNPSHYELHGKGSDIQVDAKYDKDGVLVESVLRKKNTRIPTAILHFIYSGEYSGWTITSNEKVVKDFDPHQTQYNITLSNGNREEVLQFKDYGTRIAFLQN